MDQTPQVLASTAKRQAYHLVDRTGTKGYGTVIRIIPTFTIDTSINRRAKRAKLHCR
jgi:hypothetical protein